MYRQHLFILESWDQKDDYPKGQMGERSAQIKGPGTRSTQLQIPARNLGITSVVRSEKSIEERGPHP